jgi:hypothetical protein
MMKESPVEIVDLSIPYQKTSQDNTTQKMRANVHDPSRIRMSDPSILTV